jgi:hypothetical protein
MLILIIKGGLFAFLLVLAAVWDIRNVKFRILFHYS